ncbi:MAG: multidrug effflux MFS transporter [Geminicoccaceae bacterium]|nr:multidrug effflux MFS transporter [Geminicoccaceae bacterium]MDW8340731.1 multidrug effflux MFS transporter [Geminicoccaceae bacterium]
MADADPISRATAPRGLLLVLPALVAFQAISTDLYLPALPAIGRALGAGVAEVQLTLSLFLVGFGVAQLAWGPASDRWGRRPLLLLGTALYTFASLACAAASSIETLTAFRVVQAIAACSGVVLGRAVVRDLFEPVAAARVLAYLGTAMALAPILGPILGGWLTLAFGWRATFAALALFGALAFTGVLFAVPETNRRKDPSAVRPRVLLANYRGLFADRLYLARVAVAALGYAGIFTFISGSPHVLIDAAGLRPDQYGLCFAAGVAGWMGGTFAAGRLNARLGLPGLLAIGTRTSAVAAILGLGLALASPPSWPALVFPMFLFMAGAGFTLPTAMALAIGPYPDKAGLASALLGFLQLLFAALVGFVVSGLYDRTAVPMMAILSLASLAGLLTARFASPGSDRSSR